MISRFFVDHPVFANVIAIVTILFGVVTLRKLPVEQYPAITPPTVQVTTNYPGANAQVVADTVATPIEQQVNGVEGMLYMSSSSASDGSYRLTVTFDIGTDLDVGQVLVQNRVAIAQPLLPDEVKRQGVTTKKQSPNIIMFMTLTSPDGRYDSLYLANYANLRLRDELSRVEGVGDVTVFGASAYSMRVWLDPRRLEALGLTTQDVVAAIQEQNVQVAAGQVGQPPAAQSAQQFQYTVTTLGRLTDAEQFEDIVVKSSGGRITRLRDVARVELGSQTYDQYFQKDGKPGAGIGIYPLPGANALETADRARAAMERMKRSFPEGMAYSVPLDTTLFVRSAIHEVYWTLFEASALVLIVILVFLQDWRAVLVPATTVPVTIFGAFAGMALFGFTVNLLTLFGLVLAIGIVVDDAIVIVENASHHIEREGLPPREATIQAMSEVTAPIMGITAVLMSVFIPAVFLGGITGQLYRQFALTIAVTAAISALNAVTLKPAQCAAWLRAGSGYHNAFFRGFNRIYARTEAVYVGTVARLLQRPHAAVAAFAALLGATLWWYFSLPTSFLPVEDQGYVISTVQLPDAASQSRTRAVVDRMNEIFRGEPAVAAVSTIGGFSVLDGSAASNAATFFVTLQPWSERRRPDLQQPAVLARLRHEFAAVQDAQAVVFPPPAIRGLGVTGGFQVQIEDRGDAGRAALQQVVREMIRDGSSQSGLASLNTTFREGVPQLYADVDRTKVKTLGIPLDSVFATLQAYLGSAYVNDFNRFGRTYQVRVQADSAFRATAADIERLVVRNPEGKMVPLAAMVNVREVLGPQIVSRYNLYPTAAITGEAAAGRSSGQALSIIEQMADAKLPPSMSYEWTGVSYQEKKVGREAALIFVLAVSLVYLVLAAQYESWTNPAAVVLVVPLALLGTVMAVAARGMDNNVYTQIGVVLLVALSSKNAILIVEFARQQRRRGVALVEAATEAARLRFRPILMTSFAFILGVYPLVVAGGAGAASRRALGTAVFGGMLTSTFLAVLFVPVFYVLLQGYSERRAARKLAVAGAAPAAARASRVSREDATSGRSPV
ncbi:MAG TPA: multidrug efflux RND transporter permease subunit [Myxococcota bacterium]|nr:multidrug efflux RND transporter permease subunit [Myxococcota bacterium]